MTFEFADPNILPTKQEAVSNLHHTLDLWQMQIDFRDRLKRASIVAAVVVEVWEEMDLALSAGQIAEWASNRLRRRDIHHTITESVVRHVLAGKERWTYERRFRLYHPPRWNLQDGINHENEEQDRMTEHGWIRGRHLADPPDPY